MVWCSVKNCKSCLEDNYGKQGAEIISFHKFPDDEIMKQQWIRAVGRPSWTPTAHSRICSKHFTQSSFYGFGRNRQVNDLAVPTMFLPGPDLKVVTVHIPSLNKPLKQEDVLKNNDKVVQAPFPVAISAAVPVTQPEPKRNAAVVVMNEQSNSQSKLDATLLLNQVNLLQRKVKKLGNLAQTRLSKLKCCRSKYQRLLKKNQDLNLLLDEVLEKGTINNRQIEIFASTSERRDNA